MTEPLVLMIKLVLFIVNIEMGAFTRRFCFSCSCILLNEQGIEHWIFLKLKVNLEVTQTLHMAAILVIIALSQLSWAAF